MLALSPYRIAVAVVLAGATAAQAQSPFCRSGPLPENPDNRVVLCSPDPASVQVRILAEGLELSWDAAPRASTSYVSPVLASDWEGVDSLAAIPTLELRGSYLAFRDRRIELSVLTIDSLGSGRGDHGVVGRDRIRIAWNSRYEGSLTSAVAGTFDLPPTYAGELLRFDVPNRNPLFPPDTTVAAGVRLRVRPGDVIRRQDGAFFDLEDWEGYHVWRWGGDPTSPNYEAVGEYSKLRATASPDTIAWQGVRPASRRFVFLDRDVFDGFIYHYAITAYDQGFRRATSGQDLAFKFESPLQTATANPGGGVTLGPTQIRVEFRREPPATFRPIAAVPNPFRDDAVDPVREETTKVSFINAPPRGTLYIFTLAGDLVFQREHNLPSIGTIDWDTRNQRSREKVASGVYIYKIVDLVSGEQSYGRLAIIR